MFLDFWVRRTGNPGYGPSTSVFISDNGGTTWKQIRQLNNTAQSFGHDIFDIASEAAANGLTLNNKFRIRFTYDINFNSANDGLIIDDLRIDPTDPTSGLKVFVPLVRR